MRALAPASREAMMKIMGIFEVRKASTILPVAPRWYFSERLTFSATHFFKVSLGLVQALETSCPEKG